MSSIEKILIFFARKAIARKMAKKTKSSIDWSVSVSKDTILLGKNRIFYNTFFLDSYLGFGSFIGNNCLLNKVKIGNYCSLASNIKVLSSTHPVNTFISSHPAFYLSHGNPVLTYNTGNIFQDEYLRCPEYNSEYAVIIGNDVWIGSDVIILGGVKIGDGAIIGAGAVVTKDVEPYAIVGGVPAKLIKYRFSPHQIECLLKIKWWDWSQDKLNEEAKLMNNVDSFINKHFDL